MTNQITAHELLSKGLAALTPSFDLDEQQLTAFLSPAIAPLSEMVVHHPMPLFHMEHCVFAALLSTGTSYKDCGRPCESHTVALKDRAGVAHPVEADVGCRNTVFHASAQSAAQLVPVAQRSGARRFRIELVREDAETTTRIVTSYRDLLSGSIGPADVWSRLRTEGHYGVVRGSLRMLNAR